MNILAETIKSYLITYPVRLSDSDVLRNYVHFCSASVVCLKALTSGPTTLSLASNVQALTSEPSTLSLTSNVQDLDSGPTTIVLGLECPGLGLATYDLVLGLECPGLILGTYDNCPWPPMSRT